MIELKDIVKNYIVSSGTVRALKGVNMRFRESEFVAVLGPSGCGKTTLLNIIGGLDQYTSGDLVINGTSTKAYKDRDWDTYRNHSVGFVFQSYNLIPHQNVLSNVELALTLAGMPKAERRKRAKAALIEVGLDGQFRKEPSQMSGGQMQRVAIARALVNNPDIILADEPTGALDTETSIQVMNILKEVSKKHLVVMVTHNPDLAEQYATRTIRMLDGEVLSDSMPYTDEMVEADEAKKSEREQILQSASNGACDEAFKKAGIKPNRQNMSNDTRSKTKRSKTRKSSMKLHTAFMLSLKNLFTKKGRTILTAFAGSIGIIGIALIYAVSTGTTAFINRLQEDTLASYPLQIVSEHTDMTELIETFTGSAKSNQVHDNDAVYEKMGLYNLVNAFSKLGTKKNDLENFKKAVDADLASEDSKLRDALTGVQYKYNLNMLVYTYNDVDGNIIQSDTTELMSDLFGKFWGVDTSAMGSSSSGIASMMGSYSTSDSSIWEEFLKGNDGEPVNDIIKEQYTLVTGDWPKEYNEAVLVLDENNEISDITLYALGLKSKKDIDAIFDAAINKMTIEAEMQSWTYDEIMSKDYRVVFNSDCYQVEPLTGVVFDLRDSEAGLKYLYNNALKLKVVGIIKPSGEAVSQMVSGSICYTYKLTEYVAKEGNGSDLLKKQLEDKNTDVFTGLRFKDNGTLSNEDKAEYFRSLIQNADDASKAAYYIRIMSVPSDETINSYVERTTGAMGITEIRAMMLQFISGQISMSKESLEAYINNMSDEEVMKYFKESVAEQFAATYAEQVQSAMSKYPVAALAAQMDGLVGEDADIETLAGYYDTAIEFSENTYDDNLTKLGYVDLESPSEIDFFASTFANKDVIEEFIADYNKNLEEIDKISYTDYVGLIMSSVTIIVDAITYVLIGFVSVSLVVSSIMIGVITLISVQERTKEIGILRALGASKRDVSRMFNAETFIIGLVSGLFGVGFTYAACVPINIILYNLTEIGSLKAQLPVESAVILVVISFVLTLIAGIIPAKSAAKKDPVVALRTE